jgi:L-glyceraldehyde 3-phosphate reductase
VSLLALGSWRTYERIPREQGLSVMGAARERGVTFLDDARYNDESGAAPLATGYSEVVFGQLFRAAGWGRDETVVANKLWWEFWPEQSASDELEGSLQRMGFEYVDLVYSWVAPKGPSIAEIVAAVGDLIASGKARAWGTGNWEPAEHAQAATIALELGVPPPCAAQLPYNVGVRSYVESVPAGDALERSGAGVVASFVLAGGVLTGKYDDPAAAGRMRERLDDPEVESSLRAVPVLQALAAEFDTTPASLAVAFALANERVSSVLFGATTPEQVSENIAAADLLARLTDAELDRLRRFTF